MAEAQTGQEDKRPQQPPGNGTEELPDDVDALKEALAAERKKAGTLINENKRLKRTAEGREALAERLKWALDLEEEGYTPEQIKALAEQKSAAEVQTAREKGDLDKLVANAVKVSEKKAAEAEARASKAESLVQRVLVDDVVRGLLRKYVDDKFLSAVFSHLRPKFETMEDPESEYGTRAIVKMGTDEYMSAEEWVKTWAETDDEATPFLKASMASGGGAGGGGGRDPRLRFKTRKEMSAAEKSAYIRAHGKAEYDKLPWSRD